MIPDELVFAAVGAVLAAPFAARFGYAVGRESARSSDAGQAAESGGGDG